MDTFLIPRLARAFAESEYMSQVDFSLPRSEFIKKYGPGMAQSHPLKFSDSVGEKVAAQVWDNQKQQNRVTDK